MSVVVHVEAITKVESENSGVHECVYKKTLVKLYFIYHLYSVRTLLDLKYFSVYPGGVLILLSLLLLGK